VNLQVRVGVNTGEVVVRSIRTDDAHTEYTPIGHSTSLASRLQTLASPGSIAISETVRNLVEGYFALKSLGPARIKGVSVPVNVYEVTGLGPLRTRLQRSAGRGFTKFVGRQREIDAMKAASEQAIAGHGQIVAAIAEAGIGKSRLFLEFKAMESSKWMILEASSVSHGKASAFLPVIDLLWNYFKIGDEDDDRSRREKVAGRLAILDPSLEVTRPYLFTLLGIVEGDEHHRRWEQTFDRLDEYLHRLQKKDPLAQMDAQIRRRRTLDAIKRILLRESLNQPLMLIFEDLHWIDEETQALLDLLADSIGTSQLLMLVNYRPEYSHAWTNKTYYTQVRLDPLGRESAERMLSALIGDEASLKPLCDLIVQKTDGNPFFMEEIVQGLIEDGALVRNGTTRLSRPLDTLKIPTTVQAILASRIDRLAASEKDLLQTLAVLGKEFGLGLVRAVTGKSDDVLTPTLSALQLAEFIYEQPAAGEVEFTFKHALTQEVAYGSLLVERRTLIHERIGAGIETIFAQSLDDHLGELAHHYGRSANRTKAIEYFERAGRRALQQSAFSEAIDYATRGLELLTGPSADEAHSRHELELRSTLGDALSATRGYADPQVKITLERARVLCIEAGDSARLFTVLIGLRWFFTFRLELSAACDIARQLVALAQRLGDPSMMAEARFALGHTLFLLGEFSAAGEPLEEQLKTTDVSHGHHPSYLAGDPEAMVLSLASLVLWCRGYPQRARRHSEEALTIARTLSQPYSLTLAWVFASQLHKFLRDGTAARYTAEKAIEIATQSGFGLQLAQATVHRGAGLVELEKFEQGVSELKRGIDAVEATGALPSSMYLALLGEGYSKWGRGEEGLACIATALARSAMSGEHFYDAELLRLRGEMLLAANPSASGEAEESFRSSIDLARSQDAKSWELRATTSLARMLRDTDRRDEARAMLSHVYKWFTEGFDTADLKDAKALLDGL